MNNNINNNNFNQMNNTIQTLNQFMQIGKNPQQILEYMISQNPQSKFIINQIQQSGLSFKDYTLQYAKQNNIDINSLLKVMSNFGIKL